MFKFSPGQLMQGQMSYWQLFPDLYFVSLVSVLNSRFIVYLFLGAFGGESCCSCCWCSCVRGKTKSWLYHNGKGDLENLYLHEEGSEQAVLSPHEPMTFFLHENHWIFRIMIKFIIIFDGYCVYCKYSKRSPIRNCLLFN